MTDVYEYLRFANVALCAVLTVAMLFRGAAFLRAPVASRYGRLALFAWVTWLGWGTLEGLAQHVPAGPRVPGATSVVLVTAWWVIQETRYDMAERRRIAALSSARA